MSAIPDPRYELKKITDTEWLILDHRYGSNDARQTIACLYQLDLNDLEVIWLRDLPLAERYTGAIDVLEDVEHFYANERSRRPIPIPSLPPLTMPIPALPLTATS